MKRQILAVAFAIAVSSSVLPAGAVDVTELAERAIGSVTVDAHGRVAVLIEVHEIHPVKSHGKPVGSANCSNDGPASGTYELIGWQIGITTFHYNAATTPAGLSNQTSVMQAAFNAWGGAPRVTVVGDGTATREGANRTGEILFGRTGGSLATTYTWKWNDGLVESDVVFNKSYTWVNFANEGDGCYETAGNVYDVRNIATHEYGHVYGLGHPAGARYETMYAYGYSGETLKWSPASGDNAGITANY